MVRNYGIGRKLIVFVGGSVAILMSLVGVFAVGQFAALIRERTRDEARQAVAADALRIQGFFAEHGRVVSTMLANEAFVDWFAGRTSFDQEFLSDGEYPEVVGFFERIVGSHGAVKNAFFGVNLSSEYFANKQEEMPEGRFERPDYVIHERPWWQSAVRQDRLYVTSPQVDLATGDVAVVIQTTVYRNGRLVGVAGVDILINTVRDIVNRLSYRGEGHAFLVDREGVIIAFADMDVTGETTLPDLDTRELGGSGFTDLLQHLSSDIDEMPVVRWGGEKWRVVHSNVRADDPYVDWSLGLLVPEGMIVGPVRRSMFGASVATLFAVIAVCALTLVVTRSVVTRRVKNLAERFDDIAAGRGDLTRRVEVVSEDEIGRLGSSFNRFVEAIQGDVRVVGEEAASLTGASDRLLELSQRIADSSEDTSGRAAMVSTSASQVSVNAQSVATATEELNASTGEIAESATEAARVATQAVDTAERTAASFGQLDESLATIGKFVQVIYSIAEQTNLLALNATIEAARAGEAGAGFAVVADEVKTLASETAQATEEIRQTSVVIREHTDEAGDAIASISETICHIRDLQITIASAVEQQTSTTSEIARSVHEAAVGAGEIAERISEIAEAVDLTTQASADARSAADELSTLASNLRTVVERFTY